MLLTLLQVVLSFGAWHVDGSIVMKSGVLLKGW